MTEDTRTELRVTVERLVRLANAGVGVTCELRPERRCPPEDTPPLTTAQQLALSVLVGEPDRAVLSALCDCLIEMGQEYAAAVAEKARREERERILGICQREADVWESVTGSRFTQGRALEARRIASQVDPPTGVAAAFSEATTAVEEFGRALHNLNAADTPAEAE